MGGAVARFAARLDDEGNMTRFPGTWAILRALWTTPLPHNRVYWRVRWGRVTARASRTARLSGLLRPVLPVIGVYVSIFVVGSLCVLGYFVVREAGPVTVAWGAVSGGLLMMGIGTALVAGRVSREIVDRRAHQTWVDLLLIPTERYEAVVQGVAHAVNPIPLALGFGLAGLAAVLMTTTPDLRLIMLLAALGIEGLQILALGVVIGLTSAWTRTRPGVFTLLLFMIGLGLILARTGGGWAAAAAFDTAAGPRRAALLVGPLSLLVLAGSWGGGIAFAVFYLLALEGLVRGLFAWCLAHIGEG